MIKILIYAIFRVSFSRAITLPLFNDHAVEITFMFSPSLQIILIAFAKGNWHNHQRLADHLEMFILPIYPFLKCQY